jgi:hypothetical protein
MNILSRLKKIERRIIGNNSEFCGCEIEYRCYVIYPGANGEPIREPAEDYDTPERCETCGKRTKNRLNQPLSLSLDLKRKFSDEPQTQNQANRKQSKNQSFAVLRV